MPLWDVKNLWVSVTKTLIRFLSKTWTLVSEVNEKVCWFSDRNRIYHLTSFIFNTTNLSNAQRATRANILIHQFCSQENETVELLSLSFLEIVKTLHHCLSLTNTDCVKIPTLLTFSSWLTLNHDVVFIMLWHTIESTPCK